MKYKALLTLVALAIGGGSALAGGELASTTSVSVTNTSKKGSLLIFPMITIDPAAKADTIVEISNDQTSAVHVQCYYVNEQKGRVNFDFDMTGKATVSWDVLTMSGDNISPPPFPSYGDHPEFGSIYRGELVCFATDKGVTNQIAFNHLHGTASVLGVGSAVKYSPWGFWALSATGGPENDNVIMVPDQPGLLPLDGTYGHYDACPAYNTTAFMPNGATLGNLTTGANYLAVASCNQDLRQDYKVHTTKLLFTVWNSREQSFTGSYFCTDSVRFVPLLDNNTQLVNATNFDYSTLRTPDAMFNVQGIPSTQCPAGTEAAGLLGITASLVSTTPGGPANSLVGSNIHQAGTMPGYVYWDPSNTVPFSRSKKQ